MGCKHSDYNTENLYTWCTNCGNYGIHGALKMALLDEKIKPKDSVLCFDIGCHGNGADKISGYNVHGLHGRVIPFACGVSLANRNLKVIASGGDGATLGEGINHLIHAVRNDYNITFLLHDNENYGLTTGQASPSTRKDLKMNSTPHGVTLEPLNVMDLIFGLNPTFVARGYSGNVKQLITILRSAINHNGFSFIHIMQDCPTYNQTPHEWYLEHVFDVSEVLNYNRRDINNARKFASDMVEKIATGVLYQDENISMTGNTSVRDSISNQLTEEVKPFETENLLKRYI